MNENETIIVSHDAGGAEILSSWCKSENHNFIFILDGPAKKNILLKIIRIYKFYS